MIKLDESKEDGRIIALWCLGWILGLASLVGQTMSVDYIASVKLKYILMTVLSFANWLLPCMFPKLYFTDYSTIHKKRYNVNRRRITVGMIILQEWWMLTKMPVLNLVEAKPVLFFGGILNVSVFAIFALCILPRCEKKQVMYTVGMWIFVWSIPATAFLIVAGTQKEVVSYERGMVEEKRTSDSQDSDNYYVIVVKDDRTEHKYKVTDGLYSQIEEGEVVRLTRKKSVFGIQYDEVARQ